MDVHTFFEAIAKHCDEGKCEGCGAKEFCYTAPKSITTEIIDGVIRWLDTDSNTHRAVPIH